jgi:molecular chaperone DnaK
MVSDAEAHADEDRRQRELAEARNVAENAAYQAEKQLADMGDQVDSGAKEEIENAIADVRSSLDSEDTEAIKAKTDALQQAFHKVSERIYQAAAEQQQASGAAASDGSSTDGAAAQDEEEVVDAEVVDEDRS